MTIVTSRTPSLSLVMFGVGLATYGLMLGCAAQIKIVPEVSQKPDGVQVLLRGKLFYEGKLDFLPRTIADSPENTLKIRYAYDDVQARSPLVTQFTRTHSAVLFEQPVGSKAVRVIGSLEILDGERIIKAYSAIATLSIPSELSRETLSDMRRRGLFAVRDNVEAQMFQDNEFLEGLARRQIQPASK